MFDDRRRNSSSLPDTASVAPYCRSHGRFLGPSTASVCAQMTASLVRHVPMKLRAAVDHAAGLIMLFATKQSSPMASRQTQAKLQRSGRPPASPSLFPGTRRMNAAAELLSCGFLVSECLAHRLGESSIGGMAKGVSSLLRVSTLCTMLLLMHTME